MKALFTYEQWLFESYKHSIKEQWLEDALKSMYSELITKHNPREYRFVKFSIPLELKFSTGRVYWAKCMYMPDDKTLELWATSSRNEIPDFTQYTYVNMPKELMKFSRKIKASNVFDNYEMLNDRMQQVQQWLESIDPLGRKFPIPTSYNQDSINQLPLF